MTTPSNDPAIDARLATFRQMVARAPENPLAHFGLANELLKARLWAEAVEHLEAYLARYDDEGNGFLRLGEALAALGRTDEARDVLGKGIAAALRFGHPSMAGEMEQRIEELDQ
jgi:predicted Zn-dependent protease